MLPTRFVPAPAWRPGSIWERSLAQSCCSRLRPAGCRLNPRPTHRPRAQDHRPAPKPVRSGQHSTRPVRCAVITQPMSCTGGDGSAHTGAATHGTRRASPNACSVPCATRTRQRPAPTGPPWRQTPGRMQARLKPLSVTGQCSCLAPNGPRSLTATLRCGSKLEMATACHNAGAVDCDEVDGRGGYADSDGGLLRRVMRGEGDDDGDQGTHMHGLMMVYTIWW